MPIKENQLEKIDAAIRKSYFQETHSQSRWNRLRFGALRWGQMMVHEVVRDDLAIRAQSLSYFTLFSIMPLIAGVFLLLSFFSQWGPIQTEFQSLLATILQPIPEDSRDSLLEFILKFKDDYLQRINEKSTTIGIFALGVLVWIMARVFMNVEDLMNQIWSAEKNRPWLERIQNFIFTGVMFPLISVVALSLPAIVAHYEGAKVQMIFAQVLPGALVFLCVTLTFRYLPNVKVFWRSAFVGAGVSCVLFFIANYGLKFYFQFGTGTGYGKAVVVPIVAFFIYVEWFIFMVGAEVSFLVQNQTRFTGRHFPQTTLAEAALLVEVLKMMQARFQSGDSPITAQNILNQHRVPSGAVANVLRFLEKRQFIAQIAEKPGRSGEEAKSAYTLVKAVHPDDLVKVIKDYLEIAKIEQNFDVISIIDSLLKK